MPPFESELPDAPAMFELPARPLAKQKSMLRRFMNLFRRAEPRMDEIEAQVRFHQAAHRNLEQKYQRYRGKYREALQIVEDSRQPAERLEAMKDAANMLSMSARFHGDLVQSRRDIEQKLMRHIEESQAEPAKFTADRQRFERLLSDAEERIADLQKSIADHSQSAAMAARRARVWEMPAESVKYQAGGTGASDPCPPNSFAG